MMSTPETNPAKQRVIVARPTGFLRDVLSIAIRSVRQLPRDLEAVIPALIIPLFFLVINVGSLQDVANFTAIEIDYKAFQLPVAIIFAVTGVSRAPALVLDIQNGYFDRLMLTPVSRRALLIGHIVADFALVVLLVMPVLVFGFIIGIRFPTGPFGVVTFIVMGALWGVAYTGFPYAIALRTGNPGAVNSSFLLFFPFAFITSAFVPIEAMTGWLGAAAHYNPVTYLLEGLRSLFLEWDAWALGKSLLAITGVGLLSQTFAFAALKRRVARG
ncbi:MAG: ABC transporter permease [Acidimicrobiaceae bacterium]|nr:ABC transporter permease [Acidimicrobiaceae bacterium]